MADFVQTIGTAATLLPAYTLAQIQATTPVVPCTAFAIDTGTWYYNNGAGSGWTAVAGATGPAPQQTTVQVLPAGAGTGGSGGGGALNMAAGSKGLTASSIANVASLGAQAWGKGRFGIASILNLPVSNGLTLCMADDNTSSHKFEVWAQLSSSTNAQLNLYVPGATTITINLATSALPATGQDCSWGFGWNQTAFAYVLYWFDGNGNVLGSTSPSGNFGNLPDASAGYVRVNNAGPIGHGGSRACFLDGIGIYSGAPPAAGSAAWYTRPSTSDANIVYMCLMNDASSGTSPATTAAQVGTTGLTLTGTYNYATDSTGGAWGGTAVSVTISEVAGQFVTAVNGSLQFTASTYQQGSSTPLTGRTYTWTTSAGSISGSGLLTAPGTPSTNITVTATDTGVVGALVGSAVSVYTTLANAATGASVFWTTSVNINYQTESPYNTNYAQVWTELVNGSSSTTSGGMAVEEVVFQERYLLTNLTWVNNTPTLTFGFTSADAQIAKAVGAGQLTQMRCYMLTGNPSSAAGPGGSLIASSLYSSTPANAAAVSNLLNAYVSQTVAHYIANHGTSGSGTGVLEYVVNEFMQPWYTGGAIFGTSGIGWSPTLWYQYLGTNWIVQWLQQLHTADSTATAAFVFNNIETASSTTQQANVYRMLQQVASASGIPTTISVYVEGHAGGGGYTYTNADMTALNAWLGNVTQLGFKIGVAEYDNTDTLAQNQGSSGYPVRDAQNITNMTQLFSAFAPLWSHVRSWGVWGGLSDQTSWLNNPPNPSTPYTRPDGTAQRPCLKDASYARKGGAGSVQDVYGVLMSLLSVQAA